MLLSDYVNEYRSICVHLKKCKDYIEESDKFIDIYISGTTHYTNNYFISGSSSKNNDLASDVASHTKTLYQEVKILNQKSISFLMTLGEIKILEIKNELLKNLTDAFCSLGYSSMHIISSIIIEDNDGVREGDFAQQLMNTLISLKQLYNELLETSSQFSYIEDKLLEPIPENLSDIEMEVLELRSFKHNITFSEFASDVNLLSSFIGNLEIILSKNENYTPILTRKVETGSLRIVWSGTTIEISCVSDIIRVITDAIRTFRLTGVEKTIKKEEARSMKLDNDCKSLTIINTKIEKIAEIVNLDPSSPEDKETLQRLCLPLIKYINNNPIGRIGDFNYNLSHEIQLLEDTYFKNHN